MLDFDGALRVTAARSEFARDLTKRMLRLTPFISLDLFDGRGLSALVDELIDQVHGRLR